MKPKDFTCEVCGSSFTANCVIARYCKPECKKAGADSKHQAWKLRQQAEVYPVQRICETCELPFLSDCGYQKYCKPECRKLGLKKVRALWYQRVGYAIHQGLEIRRNCRHCGDEFVVSHYRRIYCKESCRESYKVAHGTKSS
jgi:hypothetical protein